MASNVHIYIAAGIKTLISDLQVAKPTLMIVVPRVLEKVYNAASQKAGHGPKGVAFAAAVVAAQNYMKELGAKGKVGVLAKTAAPPSTRSSTRRCATCSAAAPNGSSPAAPRWTPNCSRSSAARTCPCTRLRTDGDDRAVRVQPARCAVPSGSVGIAFPGFELRVAEDEEIQVKGTAVFPKYHKNEEATEGSFTDDGWYRTGDLASSTTTASCTSPAARRI